MQIFQKMKLLKVFDIYRIIIMFYIFLFIIDDKADERLHTNRFTIHV